VRAGGPRVDRARPPLWARLYVGVFLSLFIVCGVFAIELWPLTGWRLFSTLRQPHYTGLRATIVDTAGVERPFPLGELPLAYRGTSLLIGRFEEMPVPKQDALCDALAEGARSIGMGVESVRIYRVDRDESARAGRRAADEVLTLRYTCARGSVQAAGP
jgi:hypothetical protein